ncbi:MFS transporter [Halomarina ordinaria]|uniref:MFS transporter n=1 Tax=Halomarina ordinaria TaxID=3033939 RepID=A0ABD5UHZ9_9EURY|nr:MFS transporter [Halomarina sp. PSRA2]
MTADAYGPREIRTVALAIIAGVFFGGVATGVAFPTLPLLDDLLGIGAVVLGLILSANRIARLVMNTPAGSVIDRVGARRPMILGLFVQGLAPFGYVLGLHAPRGTAVVVPGLGDVSNAALVFLSSRVMWGLGSAFVFLGAFATITHVTSADNRGTWLGYMRGGQSLGFPTGLVVGGVVADLFSVQTAFLLAGILALLAGVVAALVLPDVRPETRGRSGVRDVPRMLRREPRVLPVGLGNMAIRFMFGGVLLATVVKYAEAGSIDLGVLTATGVSGVVLGIGVVSASATTVASGRLSDRLSNRALVTVPALLAMAAGLLVLAFSPTLAGLVGGTALIGVGTGGTGPALLAILGDITPGDEIGRMGGVYNAMGDVGLSLGPLLAVPMVDVWFGFRSTYVICAAVVGLTLVVSTLPLLRAGTAPAGDVRS